MRMTHNAQGHYWVEYTLLAVASLLAAVLRFYKLGEWSYFVDELHTWSDTLRFDSRPLSTLLYPDHRQVFWLLTQLSLDTFGANAISLRLFPCIFGVLTIPLLYFPFRTLFDKRIAMLTVFMLAISHWHIYMSQMARWYTLLALLSVLALTSLYIFVERNNLKYLILYILLSYIALTLHMTAGFLFMIGFIYLSLLLLIPTFRPKNFNSKKIYVFLCIPLVFSPMILSRFVRFLESWEATKEAHGTYGEDIFIKLLYQMTPSIAFVALASLVLLLKFKDHRGLFLTVYCLFPFAALNVASLFEINVNTRYILFILPGVLLAVSCFYIHIMDQLPSNNKMILLALIAAIILPILRSDYTYFNSYYGNRDRLGEAIQFMKEKREDDDLFMPFFIHGPKDVFRFKSFAFLEGLEINDEKIITSRSQDDLDLSKRTWIVTQRSMPAHARSFDKWISENTHLLAEFKYSFGPRSRAVKVYLYSPES